MKKNAGTKTVDARREPERLVHLQGGKAHVHAIEVGDEVQEGEEWNQPEADAIDRAARDGRINRSRDTRTAGVPFSVTSKQRTRRIQKDTKEKS
jgi:hypothetical protein